VDKDELLVLVNDTLLKNGGDTKKTYDELWGKAQDDFDLLCGFAKHGHDIAKALRERQAATIN
jgi:hypothetical protein